MENVILQTLESIYKRKSTRSFQDSKISNDVLRRILCAGMQAPSPKNDQPWRFLVVEGKDKRETIANILEQQLNVLKCENDLMGIHRRDIDEAFESVRILREASIIVFVYLDIGSYEIHDDYTKWPLNAKDAECTHIMAVGAAIQNMLLAATESGVDSLWIGDIFYAYNKLEKYLGHEGCIMAAVALGHGTGVTYKSSRKIMDEIVTYI